MIRNLLLLILTQVACADWVENWQESPDYFDRLHLQTTGRFSDSRPESNVALVTDAKNNTYRMAHLTTILPFSSNNRVRSRVFNDAAAVLLAIHHFNHKETSPILHDFALQGCNVRLTTKLFDSQMNPIVGTSIIMEQVLRNGERKYNDNPPPAAIIGAYRSAVTLPMAIISGANEVPQISAMSTSTELEDAEQYPYFSRTCPSTEGEGKVVVDYLEFIGTQFNKEIRHVGILFVTDAYGASLQKAFQDYAADRDIATVSIPFGYSNEDEIPKAVELLKKTQFRYFYVICFDDHYLTIMKAASEQGITGDGFFWIFQG
jgi:hypothetical protein